MAKKVLDWKIETSNITVEWLDTDVKHAFEFTCLPMYDNMFVLEGFTTMVEHRLFVHGLKQKLADSVAGLNRKGYSATEQLNIMLKVWNNLCDNKFTAKRKGGNKITREQALKKLEESGNMSEEMVALVEKMFG